MLIFSMPLLFEAVTFSSNDGGRIKRMTLLMATTSSSSSSSSMQLEESVIDGLLALDFVF